ncbi:MAG: glycosyltransferase, partial [bacterium]|nr:glycosyltransferase [bacterium]
MKVALVHDWLTGQRGGENVLEVFCELYPDADLFTLLYLKDSVSPIIEKRRIKTSFIQHLPFAHKKYRHYLPLFPLAIEQFDLRDYDLVISTSHCVAKGAISSPQACHICYCHTPMRYIWDLYRDYFPNGKNKRIRNLMISPVVHYLRLWDQVSSNRVDYFIANSKNIADKIRKYYRRDATVIYPPVDTTFFSPAQTHAAVDYYLIVSAFVPYKKIKLAIRAFNQTGKRLKIAGNGPEYNQLKQLANPSNIEFLGWVFGQPLRELYLGCRALLMPGPEDFGITPLEAMSCGKPVIAYKKGGVLESVVENITGIFFDESTPEAIITAVNRFEQISLSSDQIRQHALTFDKQQFISQISRYIET